MARDVGIARAIGIAPGTILRFVQGDAHPVNPTP
jgi:hypothetical protein